jgi:hypothetical protein
MILLRYADYNLTRNSAQRVAVLDRLVTTVGILAATLVDGSLKEAVGEKPSMLPACLLGVIAII